ncbi:MAG: single-stranded DNA-binding protein, partial [Clostridia bacterium]|nr:single-stranded DNA-binding protein [Clostridia bacterium]
MCAAHFNSSNLVGKVTALPEVSHVSHGSTILRFFVSSERLSGARDELPVICRRETAGDIPLAVGTNLALEGEIRSYNDRTETGNRLCLSVFARSLQVSEEQDRNEVMMAGTICKPPVFRRTPLGREIADVMLAINRRYRKSDYIPVILWGSNARRAAKLSVGSYIAFEGRMQSRKYI